MKDTPRSRSRRDFFNTSLAVAAGAGVAATLVQATPAAASRGASFELPQGSFPEVPVVVAVSLPDVREHARGHAWLHLRTPREHLVHDLGEVTFVRGQARLETSLRYPYDSRVPGQYSYHVEVACGDQRVVTEAPATYSLRKFRYFS